MDRPVIFKVLNGYRRARKMTWAEVARRTGLSRSVFTKWRRSGQAPDLSSLIRLADLFSVSVDEILGRVASDPPESGEFLAPDERRIVYAYRKKNPRTKRAIRTILGA